MSDELTYECPHCEAEVPVANALAGKMVSCPRCEQHFQAQAPLARPTGVQEGSTETEVVEREAHSERVLRRLHPVAFRNHLVLTILGACLALAGAAALVMGLAGEAVWGLAGSTLLISGGVMVVAAIAYFVYRWLQRISVTLQVTTQRTILLRGLVSRSTNEVQHDDVRNIKSDRNVLERLLGYGDLALSSSGQDDMEIVVHDIPDPAGVIDIIRRHQ